MISHIIYTPLLSTRLHMHIYTGDTDDTSKFYMSPEETLGRETDNKADVYALGVIFFELNCPFTSEEDKIEVPLSY